MDTFNLSTNYLALAFIIIGAMAFVISVITEVTKNVGFLKHVPTDSQVIVLSILLCQVAYFAYISYFKIEVQWYHVAGCFIAAFMVAFVAMYGWDKLTALYKRFKKIDETSPGNY